MKRLPVLLALLLAGCGPGHVERFYVLAPTAKESLFTQDLATILTRKGYRTSLAEAWNSKPTIYVLEGKGRGFRIWAQNVPLSSQQSARGCNVESDPGQFTVRITARLKGRADSARAEAEFVKIKLKQLNYTILQHPIECSEAARKWVP